MRCFFPLAAAAILLTACSFDYDTASGSDKGRPDIVMDNLEYVRVRGGDPLVRFQAEHAERWEESQTMDLRNFSFEQLEDHGETINAAGRAGDAAVQLNSGNLTLKNGVRISIESEDITIRTASLEWKDKEKTLSGAPENEVDIERSDGTSFSGRGFFADARNRTWNFSGEVFGKYVEKEDSKDKEEVKEPTSTSEGRTPIQREEPGQFIPAQEESFPGPEPSAGTQQEQTSLPAEIPETSIPAPDLFPEPKPSIPELPEDK